MKILIVYDSIFGNTEKIAVAVAEPLMARNDVRLLRAADAGPRDLAGVGLLVVGSPTRAFRPTKAVTSFLRRIPRAGLKGIRTAAFDTRISPEKIRSGLLDFMVKIFGYAEDSMTRLLKRKAASGTVPAEGFFVLGSEGPLKDGELSRASTWANQLL